MARAANSKAATVRYARESSNRMPSRRFPRFQFGCEPRTWRFGHRRAPGAGAVRMPRNVNGACKAAPDFMSNQEMIGRRMTIGPRSFGTALALDCFASF